MSNGRWSLGSVVQMDGINGVYFGVASRHCRVIYQGIIRVTIRRIQSPKAIIANLLIQKQIPNPNFKPSELILDHHLGVT